MIDLQMGKNSIERASPDMNSTQFEYGLARFQSGYRAQITYKIKLGVRFSIRLWKKIGRTSPIKIRRDPNLV